MRDKVFLVFIGQLFLTLTFLIVSSSTPYWLNMRYTEAIDSTSKTSYLTVKEYKGLFHYCIQRKMGETFVFNATETPPSGIASDKASQSSNTKENAKDSSSQGTGKLNEKSNNDNTTGVSSFIPDVENNKEAETNKGKNKNRIKSKENDGDDFGFLKDHEHDKLLSKRVKSYCGSMLKRLAQFEEFKKYHPQGKNILEMNIKIGVFLDSNLSWKSHLTELSKNLARIAGLFYNIRHHAPTDTLTLLYHGIFAPFISYG